MIFEYSGTKTFNKLLEIDDYGNCAILAHGYYSVGKGARFPGDYYMIVRTIDGMTTILKWGAVTELTELVSGYSLDVKQFKYKEASIHREIQLFLNDGQKFIYEANVIDIDAALEKTPKDYNFVATLERA
jgi:hypothetical protein